MIVLCSAHAAPVERVLYNFKDDGPDGFLPNAGVVADNSGALYGVTPYGGQSGEYVGAGIVFKLTPPENGRGAWSENLIHSFGVPARGVTPSSHLVMDAHGALYGATSEGGSGSCYFNSGCGVIFMLTPPAAAGDNWTERAIYTFTGGLDGAQPAAALIVGRDGALYGTASSGGEGGVGVVFKLTPPAPGKTKWTETVLYSFGGWTGSTVDDENPHGGLVFDKEGALYGTTAGANAQTGTVFRLTPPAKGSTGWTETVLYAFQGDKHGGGPFGDLIIDAGGALYGTTANGGGGTCPSGGLLTTGCGVVFKLAPPAPGRKTWSESILRQFAGGSDGANPYGAVIADAKGVLYGTTSNGGGHDCIFSGLVYGCGTIFKLAPPTAGKSGWAETILYRFPESDSDGYTSFPNGIEPLDGLAVDRDGNLFGTANVGGDTGEGLVFELAGSGFAVR